MVGSFGEKDKIQRDELRCTRLISKPNRIIPSQNSHVVLHLEAVWYWQIVGNQGQILAATLKEKGINPDWKKNLFPPQ